MDRTLVEQAQRGDRDAYEALARAAAPRLYRTATRIIRDLDRAQDAVQQTLVAIWQELPSLRDPDRFDAWTYRLVVRFCTADDRRDRRAGFRRVSIDALPDELHGHVDGTATIDLRDRLDRALREMSLEHRTVVVLHHYAGLSSADVAEILGVPYGTVGSRLHTAMRLLRTSLVAEDSAAAIGGQPA